MSDMPIYAKIRTLIHQKEDRERRRISYRTIAKETGLSLGTVADYASGKNQRFDRDVLEKLCEYFGVEDVGQILGYTRPG